MDTLKRIKRLNMNDMASNFFFYNQFLFFCRMKLSKSIERSAVSFVDHSITMLFNEKFCKNLNDKELRFILFHEILHIFHVHYNRQGYGTSEQDNIVKDMVINTTIKEKIIPKKPELISILDNIYFTPKEYEGEMIFEFLSKWILENIQERRKLCEEKGIPYPEDLSDSIEHWNPKLSNETNNTFDNYEFIKNDMMTINDDNDDCSPDLKEEIRDEIINKLRNRGVIDGDVEEILSKLVKKKDRRMEYIFRQLSNQMIGTKKKPTWKKPHKKSKWKKGHKRYNNQINLILDTSGSMTDKFNKVLSYVFRRDVMFNLIQIDTKVQSCELIRSMGNLQKIKLKGLGGTVLQPAIDYMIEKGMTKDALLLMTDGYTDDLDFKGAFLKGVLILTTGKEVSCVGAKNLKQVKIE